MAMGPNWFHVAPPAFKNTPAMTQRAGEQQAAMCAIGPLVPVPWTTGDPALLVVLTGPM
jgi:hypothetical protein